MGMAPPAQSTGIQVGERAEFLRGQRPPGSYPDQAAPSPLAKAANQWLRANPHRLNLGRLGLILRHPDGSPASLPDLTATRQTLDLWQGLLDSRFTMDGHAVRVLTVCHPERDLLAVCIESPRLQNQRLGVQLAFPYGSDNWRNPSDRTKPNRHTTTLRIQGNQGRFE